ncbi:Mss4-like protein [Lasiosphaeris hirsuta]|uniref:Mss4-like protein n=1 Tax=Lasiosphaeris hirsuta TaxID=260670 RepID=A0AA40AY45_9PEZI|nr:Mss4-like protein [Lasiosphaeris hirsuta]
MNVQCQCGAVAFKTPTTTPLAVYHCHCVDCRRQSSTAFGTSVIFPADGIFPLADNLKNVLNCWARPAKEGRTVDCYFCSKCGVRIMHRLRDADGTERGTVSMKGGLLEGLNWKGAKHIYVKSAVTEVPEGVDTWEGSPGPDYY